MLTVTKRFSWAMAHRLGDHYDGPCRSLHGHEYSAEVTLAADELDEQGMVVDFGDMKASFKGCIDQNLDHGVMLEEDSGINVVLENAFIKSKMKYVMVPFIPTAENMTEWLFNQLDQQMRHDFAGQVKNRGLRLITLRVFETPDSWCTVTA